MNYSQDMFEDSFVQDDVQLDGIDDSPKEEEKWFGVPLEEIKAISVFDHLPPVRPSSKHQVLFQIPIRRDETPEPYPTGDPVDVWDSSHVRMPYSPRSLFPVSQSEVKPRWALIKKALGQPIRTSQELEAAILSYNNASKHCIPFVALHDFFNETLVEEESVEFFSTMLPKIVGLALEVESKVKRGLRFLRRGENRSLSLSQEQIASLLANAFLSTFPSRNSPSPRSRLPSINFLRLFQCGSYATTQEKLKCFINYFRRVCTSRPTGVVTYSRRHVSSNNLPVWSSCKELLPQVHVTSEGTIEDQGAGLLEVDFANKFVGGGVLGRGSVQEEIKFLICPELVIARLFTEALDDTEALLVTGCERFNMHEGYGQSFTWSGDFREPERRYDSSGRLASTVVAIDALYFSDSEAQYSRQSINRELNKAYTGFAIDGPRGGGLATGNWGCGAFNGDARLKALLQLMAAAAAGKSVAYFTFGDLQLARDIHLVWSTLLSARITVGGLWRLLARYCDVRSSSAPPLYDFILSSIASITKEMPCRRVNQEEDDADEDSASRQQDTDSPAKPPHSDISHSPTGSKIKCDNSKIGGIKELDQSTNSPDKIKHNASINPKRNDYEDRVKTSDKYDREKSNEFLNKISSESKTKQAKKEELSKSSNHLRKYFDQRIWGGNKYRLTSSGKTHNGESTTTSDFSEKSEGIKSENDITTSDKKQSIKKKESPIALDKEESGEESSEMKRERRQSDEERTKRQRTGEWSSPERAAEPVAGEICSLATVEGREKCLAPEQVAGETCSLATAEGKDRSLTAEPVAGEICSLATVEGRDKCLAAEQARWKAYRSIVEACTPPPRKRKISDYFQKANK